VFATTVAKDVAEIRTELIKSEALKPVVPTIQVTDVSVQDVAKLVEKISPLYKDVNISASGSSIKVASGSGRYFGAFREAINHAYNGGQGWRLTLESLCVGRECEGSFLAGQFKVSRLKVRR
jgi:hypothetical protein